MRRPLRFVDGPARVVDLDVEVAPDATLGDLADALAGLPTGASGAERAVPLTVVSRWPLDGRTSPPPRSAPLATHGPRAGSTVLLVPSAGPASAPTERAPVRLVGPGADELHLVYGENRLGDTAIDVTDHVTVRSLGASTTRLAGAPVLGSARVGHGDLLTIAGVPRTVSVDGSLHPPARRGWTRSHARRPEVTRPHEPVTVRLPTPPASTRTPGFPVLSATVPLLMAVALWIATGSWLAAGFMLFSVVFVVASGLEARRESRAEDRARVAEFREAVAEAQAHLDALAADQRRRHESMGCSPEQVRALVAPGDDRPHASLWARLATDGAGPSLRVRLGTGTLPFEGHVVVAESGRRDLRHELEQLARTRSTVDDVVTIDLATTGGLVVEGSDERAAAVARSVVLQLAALIGPDQLGIAVVAHGDRAQVWRDLRWLPHGMPGRRSDWLVVVDGAGPHELAAAARRHGADSAAVLWIIPTGAPRPAGVSAVLEVHVDRGRLRTDPPGGVTDVVDDIVLEPLQPEDSEPLARCLAGQAPAPAPKWRPTSPGAPDEVGELVDSVRLRDVVAAPDLLVDPNAVASRWSEHRAAHLATPVGVDEHGGVVDVDLAHDGPHALVAGTTGAGKSELLRTLLVSAALHHSPERLQFLLVDYKGGAAFGPLTDLPHTVGTITDLSGPLARRGLVSLRAELRRREEAVASLGADRWSGAALWVVVDELATLVAEQPEFVDGLVDLAQRGRSLGIHLVLATQRPAGVVTDAIRANATMRIALRVADEDDSHDVVDSAAAAHLPREVPGRAVVRLGPARVATVQVAFCGAPPRPDATVDIEPWDRARAAGVGSLHAPLTDRGDGTDTRTATDATTELTLAVSTLVAAAQLVDLPPARRPWLEELPTTLDLDGLPVATHHGALVIGSLDRPDLGCREPLPIDLVHEGGLVVIGASGAGASTVVRTIAAAADRDPLGPWHVHVIDHSGQLADLVDLPAVGDVIGVHDTERVLRLLRATVALLSNDRRGHRPGAPRRLVVIDGLGAMEERYEGIDRGEAMDLLARIARDGRSAGVHLVVTARRRAEVPAAIGGAVSGRLVLRCATVDDAAMLGLDDAAASPDLPPGRCRLGPHVGQVAIADLTRQRPDPATRPAREPASPVPRLPTIVGPGELDTSAEAPGLVAVGLDADALVTTHLDLRHHHGIVAGPPRSGVSSTLRTLVDRHPHGRLVARPEQEELGAACRWALELAGAGRHTMVAVDDVPDLLDAPDGDASAALLADLVRAARDLPVRLVLGGEVEALSRCYQDVVASVRRGRTGVLLGDDAELHGALLHATLRNRSDLPAAAGRGWLLGPGTACRVQVALG